MQVNQMPFMRRGPSRRKEGYTLIEVLFAILIAAITASVLFTAFDNGFALLRTTREDLRATQILLQKTEAIRAMPWANLPAATTFQETYFPQGTNQGTLYYGTISYITPANMPAAYQNQVELVTISLFWTNYLGQTAVPHSRQMQTLYAQYGM
jgi:prepilin-type N-terminal cleavage/methylation domain-containing protein